MRPRYVLLLLLALCLTPTVRAEDVFGDLGSLQEACSSLTNLNRRFCISGRLISYFRRVRTREWILAIASSNRVMQVYEFNRPGCPAVNIDRPHLNDLVRLSGKIYEYRGKAYPGYTEARPLESANPNEGIRTCRTPSELFHHASPNRLLRISGSIRDFVRDESDSNFIHLTLCCQGETLNVMVHHTADTTVNPAKYIGAFATVTGIGSVSNNGLRRYLGRYLAVSELENVVLSSPPVSSQELDSASRSETPIAGIAGLYQAEGDVLCAWQPNMALIRTRAGNIAKLRFLGHRLPAFGQQIRARGIPETDLYFLNLVNATWEQIGVTTQAPPPQDYASPQSLLFDEFGHPTIKITAHGQVIRLSGIVRHLPQLPEQDTRFHIESSGCLIPVDVGANRDVLRHLVIGSSVSVTGTCVLDIDSYGIGTSIPQARGFFLVLRTSDDLVILSRPSWWTPFRLLCVIGALLLVLAGILVWNTMLRRLAERRGRELADEQVKSVTSELKVYERTHLAVELHDSLSQTLSGVSMQIDAVGRFADTDRERMHTHLGIAAKTLKSCRDELRNCLLDLRSNALEEHDMNAAIRKTLEPYLDDAEIAIRFFIPREIFSDNTAHMVLRMIRELVVNALRHGQADRIKVAGSIEGRMLMFSVRDNGRGFDPENAPGIANGHFGLQGIRERIEELGGTFEIASMPGRGAKATVTIELVQDTTGDANA